MEELPGAETTMIPFRDYPPGVSLIIYYICRYAGHSQGMMLLAQNGVLFACFFALAGPGERRPEAVPGPGVRCRGAGVQRGNALRFSVLSVGRRCGSAGYPGTGSLGSRDPGREI